jgi:hypothetical protein
MTAAEVLIQLRSRGVQLWREGEALRYRAPSGVLSPELKSEVGPCKPDLLCLLTLETEGWHLEDAALILWFRTAALPTASFTLKPGQTVVEPILFYAALEQDISEGPEGVRARLGLLRYDLQCMRKLFGWSNGGGDENLRNPVRPPQRL